MNTLSLTNEYNDAIVQFLRDTGLAAESLSETDSLEKRMSAIITSLGDLFSLQEPTISSDLNTTLRLIARDAKLSNIMRERALYRLYLVTTTTKEENGATVPMWYGIVDDDGVMITSQEEFIRLFTKQSGIGRASTFRRIRVYNQLAVFGLTGQDAWIKVLQMPYTIQELLDKIANWNRSELLGLDTDVVRSVVRKMLPDQVDNLEKSIEAGDDLMSVYVPAVGKMLKEIESYEDAKEALYHVKHDILGVPSVSYRWLPEAEMIMVTTTTPIIEDGQIISEQTTETALYIDSTDPPKAMMDDLFQRLPIANRHDLPN